MSTPVAVVTGASGGLGSVVTPAFLEAGYRVVAVAKDWPTEPAANDEQLNITADLTRSCACDRIVQQAIHRFGQVDCLVHLVGIFEEGQPIEDTSDERGPRF